MAQPASRSEFKNYCLRQLGAPVLEINVADEQIDDIIDDSLQYFHERHFDGVMTIVSKLLNLIRPDFMFLREKDIQQIFILKK